jgi:lysophospholipase L1-like esterase
MYGYQFKHLYKRNRRDIMANILEKIQAIRQAIYGKDVRENIASSIEEINTEVESTTGKQNLLEVEFDQMIINAGSSNAEIVQARVNAEGAAYASLQERLNNSDTRLADNVQELLQINSNVDTTARTSQAINTKRYAFVEQFISSFYSRGQLLAEVATENTFTEQAIAANASVGAGSVVVTNASVFKVGSGVTIKHDDGTYQTHFIRTIAANTLSISPPLQKAVTTASKIEKTWFNSAHPGKFGIRYLAQRLATETEAKSGYGERIFYANFEGNSLDDVGTVVAGGEIGYSAAVNKEGADYGATLGSGIGKCAYFVAAAISGIKLPVFSAYKGESLVLRMFAMSRNAANNTRIAIKDITNTYTLASLEITGANAQIMKPYVLKFVVPHNVDRMYVEVVNLSTGLPSNTVYIDEIEVLRNVQVDEYILPRTGKIIGFGDSWVSGDEISTSERESMLTHLATLLPDATIINKGVGGNTLIDLLARFDADVKPYNPNAVIVNVGTNDAYNPMSGVFDPNSLDYFESAMRELINKIIDIGAKPIIIGNPALPEAVGAATDFLLNDRSRSYLKRVYSSLYPKSYGIPSVKNTGVNRYGLLTDSGAYLSGNNYKDIKVTIATAPIKVKRVGILAKAFDSATAANVTLKIYDATRTTVLATSEAITIDADSGLHPIYFTFPLITLAAATNYVFAFEGTNLWSVNYGDAIGGVSKAYGGFTISEFKMGNTTPPATVNANWFSLLLVPMVGAQKVFVDNIPTRYKVSPELAMIDSDGIVSIFNEEGRALISFHAKLGDEFTFVD